MSVEDMVKDLRKQVTLLEDDLRVRASEVPESASALREEYAGAKQASRTAATYESWLDERVTQVAAAWVLGTVFVRYCEDNGLIAWPFIAGPGERLADAEERHEAYFREHPDHNDRDWVIAAFDHLAAAHPTAAGLFDREHNPLWEIPPSFEAATALLQFWRRRGDDGEIRFDFTGWDTRFLGDLYQDLSEHARKTYALLQTPEFVEEFILDLTLEPAVEEFGLTGLRTIDPACGSGHFLLGIFRRLLAKWRDAEPDTDVWQLIRRSLESVHGCDKNPFAASIARFRLLVQVLQSAKVEQLDQAPDFPVNIAVGDSLMHGRGVNWEQIELDLFEGRERHAYRTEDVNEFVKSCDLLGLYSYHVVVGNPPYVTVRDKQENENYRHIYNKVCSGKYALSVPFIQRLFDLAIRAHGYNREAGFIGQITANSFMKREFGKKLIEEFFQSVHLTHVIDTSGAYIPGHGTPTVILIGRNHISRDSDPIRALLGMRGEPRQPAEPVNGLVWSAIRRQITSATSDSEWISAADVERSRFRSFPWSVSGGGAGDLLRCITNNALASTLSDRVALTGFVAITAEDDAFFMDDVAAVRRAFVEAARPMITGDVVRDYAAQADTISIWPYSADLEVRSIDEIPNIARYLWPSRRVLQRRKRFGVFIENISALAWYEYGELYRDKLRTPLTITFGEVATHNHFVLDRDGKVFNRTAPVIKLPEGASEDEHLALLGALNSSTACFWLKEVCFSKGGSGMGRGIQPEDWMERFAFNASNVEDFPLPANLPLEYGRELDSLAQRIIAHEPPALSSSA